MLINDLYIYYIQNSPSTLNILFICYLNKTFLFLSKLDNYFLLQQKYNINVTLINETLITI